MEFRKLDIPICRCLDLNLFELQTSLLRQLGCCGVVVITSVLHTEGLQFDPGQQHMFLFFLLQNCLNILCADNFLKNKIFLFADNLMC